MTTTVDHTDANLDRAHGEVKAEIFRTDTKASLLLAFNGAVMAASYQVATDLTLPLASLIAVGMVALDLVASAAVLLAAVRPYLGAARVGFPYWATLTPARLRVEMAEDRRAEDIVGLSRLAVRKMQSLQQAIDITRWAVVPAAAVAVLAVIA